MKDFVKRMIEEHKALCERINKLFDFIYSDKSNEVSREEYANMVVQLNAMSSYAAALETRLTNYNICVENGTYFEAVDTLVKEDK